MASAISGISSSYPKSMLWVHSPLALSWSRPVRAQNRSQAIFSSGHMSSARWSEVAYME